MTAPLCWSPEIRVSHNSHSHNIKWFVPPKPESHKPHHEIHTTSLPSNRRRQRWYNFFKNFSPDTFSRLAAVPDARTRDTSLLLRTLPSRAKTPTKPSRIASKLFHAYNLGYRGHSWDRYFFYLTQLQQVSSSARMKDRQGKNRNLHLLICQNCSIKMTPTRHQTRRFLPAPHFQLWWQLSAGTFL